jgi:peptide methionine sulfoxide reductase msrA/msrB
MKKLLIFLIIFFSVSRFPVFGEAEKGEKVALATFGGGCFWGLERNFEKQDGVIDVVSGYSGGKGEDPVYKDYKKKGHTEVVRIKYNPSRISYKQLLKIFWGHIGRRCHLKSQGTAYKTVIFYHNDTQKKEAEASKKELEGSGEEKKAIYTAIIKVSKFYKAEEYHQDYHQKMQKRK